MTTSHELITLSDDSLGVMFSAVFVCVSVCSVYPRDISINDAASITKLDLEMFHDES